MRFLFFAKNKGYIYHIISTIFMGISPVLSKLGLESTQPIYAASISCLITSLLTFLGTSPAKWDKRHFLESNLILIGSLNGLAIGFLFVALSTTTPDIVAFINRFYIFFVVLWGFFILKERISFIELIFLGLAVVGLFLFSCRQLDWNFYHGILFSFLSAIIFSLSNFYTKKVLVTVHHHQVIFVTNIVSCFFLMLIGFIFIKKIGGIPTLRDIIFIGLGALSGGYLGLNFFYKGLKESDFHVAGIIRCFVPLITMIYSIPIFGLAPFTSLNLIGAFLLFFSLLAFSCTKLVNKEQLQKDRAKT